MKSVDEATRLLEISSINSANLEHPVSTTNFSHAELDISPANKNNTPNTAISNYGKKCGTYAAYTFTTMSMIIQGILAFLLWEVIWRNIAREGVSSIIYECLLYLVGTPLFIGAVIGKVGLVIPYNKISFEELGASVQLLIHNPKEFIAHKKHDFQRLTMLEIIAYVPNIIMTLIAATVFGVGLTNLGANGIARLLNGYNRPFLNVIAKYVVTYYFQTPFIFSSMACNLLGFPSIHRNAFARLRQFLSFFTTNPSYFHLHEDVMRCLLAANLQLKIGIEEKNSEKLNIFLNDLLSSSEEDQFNLAIESLASNQVDDILHNKISMAPLIRLGRRSILSVKIEYGIEFVVTSSVSVIILALVLRGLLNFFNYTEQTMKLLGMPYLSVAAGVLDYLSMSAIALDAVFMPTVSFLKSIFFGRNYEANIISFPARLTLGILTAFLIGLGGFPNGYQEAQLGGSRLEVGIAIFAAWIELFGTYNLIKNSIEKYKTNKNLYDKLIFHLQSQINDVINELSKLSPDEIKHLSQLYVAPDQSEKIQSIQPERKSYVWLKKSIRHCLWHTHQSKQIETDSVNQETFTSRQRSTIQY